MAAVRDGLASTALGELDEIKSLPGMLQASAQSLRKAWLAGIDLSARAKAHPRIASMAALEAAVIARLPPDMMRPIDLVRRATQRVTRRLRSSARSRSSGMTELSPVWRPLLEALSAEVPTTWTAGPRAVPTWLGSTRVKVQRSGACSPEVIVTSAATALHEVIEALRWARELLASGRAAPHEIAIASTSPAEYDDHMVALRAEAGLDVHFVHGLKVLATRDGQGAAALADLLVRGLTQNRVRRLANLANGPRSGVQTAPEGSSDLPPTHPFPRSGPGSAWSSKSPPINGRMVSITPRICWQLLSCWRAAPRLLRKREICSWADVRTSYGRARLPAGLQLRSTRRSTR